MGALVCSFSCLLFFFFDVGFHTVLSDLPCVLLFDANALYRRL